MSDNLKNNVRRLRKAIGLTQPALAKKAKCSQTTISDIERGRNTTSKELPAIAKALGVTVENLLGGGSDFYIAEKAGSYFAPSFVEVPL